MSAGYNHQEKHKKNDRDLDDLVRWERSRSNRVTRHSSRLSATNYDLDGGQEGNRIALPSEPKRLLEEIP